MLCVWGLLEQQSDLSRRSSPSCSGSARRRSSADPKAYRAAVWTIAYRLLLQDRAALLDAPGAARRARTSISQDLRFNALPLYFSRPLRRIDYFLGKLGVIGFFLAAMVGRPGGRAPTARRGVQPRPRRRPRHAPRCSGRRPAYGLVIVAVGRHADAGAVVAVAQLALRRRCSGSAVWFVSGIVAGVLTETVHAATGARWCRTAANLGQPPARSCSASETAQDASSLDALRVEASARPRLAARRRLPSDRPTCRASARTARHRRRLAARAGRDRPPPMTTRTQVPGSARRCPQYPWYWSAGVLAGLFGCLGMDPDHPREVAGPAEMTPDRRVRRRLEVVRQRHRPEQADAAHPRRASPACSAPTAPARSTLLQLATGQLRPSQGTVRVLGQRVWNNPALNRLHRPVPGAGRLLRVDDRPRLRPHLRPAQRAGPAARRARPPTRAIDAVGMTEHMDRAIRGYSKGMRQRTKLAQALVHDPRRAVPRRAAHRHRPGGPPRPDRHHPRLGDDGQKRARVQPRAARGPGADAATSCC